MTDEVVNNIQDGLMDIKVLRFKFVRCALRRSPMDLKRPCAMYPTFPGGDVVPLRVQCSSGCGGWSVARLTGILPAYVRGFDH